jgi:prepilin peptidase CpaA
MPTATVIAVAATAALSAAIDVRTRRIPNAITLSAACLGLVLAAIGWSRLSIGASLAGFAIGMLLMLPGHMLGRTGGGDVKLFAALGTMLGPSAIFVAFLYTAICGGVLALGYAAVRGRLQATLSGTGRLIVKPSSDTKTEIEAPARGNTFPYGPAIAAGVMLVALGF